MKNHKLGVLKLGFALGMTWSLGMLCLGLMAWQLHWGTNMVAVLGDLYIGYAPTLAGSIIGAIWGFFDCFIAGAMIAWFYNLLP